MDKNIRAEIKVQGVVQGVGFRPFVHRLAKRYGLVGKVSNTSDGASITAEGSREALADFAAALGAEHPFLARIERVETVYGRATGEYRSFSIAGSRVFERRNTLISPDAAVCPDCLREMRDPANRRFRYPFINCTCCGPRFTIIEDVPYDRASTTMAKFTMCADCREEYTDIDNRRYHAEPVCCPVCGPHLSFIDGKEWSERAYTFGGQEMPDSECIRRAAEALKNHRILAIKGLGGFHLACLFDQDQTPALLRARKHRDGKPFAVMCKDVGTARRFCEINDSEQALLESPARPIVLLRKKDPGSFPSVSENRYIGVMLGYTPVHFLLFDEGIDSMVMTSANRSDLPIIFENEEALTALSGVADAFLVNDRDIRTRCDDSVIYAVGDAPYPVRRSRGYVPYPLTYAPAETGPHILACGAEQKACFALTKGAYVFPSQHIGDLKNIETLEHYKQQIKHFENMFSIIPEAIACDLHPDYLSSEYASERAEKEQLPLVRVQHHFAHMVSCIADNALEGDVIGIIWDGTGLGTDGTVWGGEFLAGSCGHFERRGSLRPFRLPGGDRAVTEIWRIGASLMAECGLLTKEGCRGGADRKAPLPGEDPARGDTAAGVTPDRAAIVENMLSAGINSPVTTSMGRLFDGASSILGIRQEVTYEGQGAVLLETAAAEECDDIFPYGISKDEEGCWRFDYAPMFEMMLRMRGEQTGTDTLAAMFMNTMAAMAADICGRIREETGLSRAVLSGGCFQNLYLLERVTDRLRENGFEVFRHRRVPCNDEGICLGQAKAAAAMLKRMTGEEYVSCGTAENNINERQ